ncbi:MAG: nuclear transport factor 2 family protein [Alphaproteobacteria bacterium]|jgi:ketosteroid isomerase-like protein|nr:nuclear transport factor 2 family protein [Alphaproteobacteria bacterium]
MSLEDLLMEREIERLIAKYCHFIDHGEAARAVDLFTEDAVWDWRHGNIILTGHAGLLKGFTHRQKNARRISRHISYNSLIERTGSDTATGVVYFTLYRHDGEEGRSFSPLDEAEVMIGEYRDIYHKTQEGWRIHRRDIAVSFARGYGVAEPQS